MELRVLAVLGSLTTVCLQIPGSSEWGWSWNLWHGKKLVKKFWKRLKKQEIDFWTQFNSFFTFIFQHFIIILFFKSFLFGFCFSIFNQLRWLKRSKLFLFFFSSFWMCCSTITKFTLSPFVDKKRKSTTYCIQLYPYQKSSNQAHITTQFLYSTKHLLTSVHFPSNLYILFLNLYEYNFIKINN